jgi:NAD+ synthase
MNNVSKHIVNWLKSYALKNDQSGFVIGVSGGIDSAVTSTLCAETNLPTIVVSLPIKEKIGHNLSLEHIDFLCKKYSNVKSQEIDLTNTFNSFYDSVSHTSDDDNLCMANVRSRLRMISLYYIAQSNKMLVVGTGNKIEDFGIGFFTKYGDGGVDISPIADLMKSEVYELGRHLDIPQNIINAKPTDGLWTDGRTDEDQIGATYDELEWAMNFLDNGVIDHNNHSDFDRQRQVLKIFQTRNSINRHKMGLIPVCKIDKSLLKNTLN